MTVLKYINIRIIKGANYRMNMQKYYMYSSINLPLITYFLYILSLAISSLGQALLILITVKVEGTLLV